MSVFGPVTAFGYSPQILDYKVFASSGTWIKPSFGKFITVECWGGGGSGARTDATGTNSVPTYLTGGCGGMYVYRIFRISELPHNVSITIGSGGTAITTGTNYGNNGGDTLFGSFVSAKGGSGGYVESGYYLTSQLSGPAGGTSCPYVSEQYYKIVLGTTSFFNSGYAGIVDGGTTVYGGASGGGYYYSYDEIEEQSSYAAGTVGTTKFGGAGGLGSSFTSNAIDGSAPGGGGGAHLSYTDDNTYKSGAGARGECRVTVW